MRIKSIFLAVLFTLATGAPAAFAAEAEKTITENEHGTHDGYDYELWKDEGESTMVLTEGGTFKCEWYLANNVLFRKGKKFDETQTHEEIGNVSVSYVCDYRPLGSSYLCVYGWTVEPLVEYYVVDSWGNWRPPGAEPKGTITVDGGTYEIYETTRTEQPSIKGTATFQQYWSVRTEKRKDGTISLSEHFKAWESAGMKMGKMYEAALTIEGYQSNGKAEILSHEIEIGGEPTDQEVVVTLPDAEEEPVAPDEVAPVAETPSPEPTPTAAVADDTAVPPPADTRPNPWIIPGIIAALVAAAGIAAAVIFRRKKP